MGAILIGFLNVCLTCAIIILIAFVIVWVFNLVFSIQIDANVYKWGKIVVGLMCAIVIFSWLLSLIPGMGVTPVGVRVFH